MIFRRSSGLLFEPRGLLMTVSCWLAVAAVLWLGAGAIDRKTTVEIFSDGTNIHLDVAGTTLSAAVAQSRLTAVEIRASDSIAPPGGHRLKISTKSETILDQRLPTRFSFGSEGVTPVGDWDIDGQVAGGTVVRREVEVSGPYLLEASFRGRFLENLSLFLEGEPAVTVVVRRGLINNDCFIRDGAGWDLAGTTLDPTPLQDLGAVAATLLRAAAIASMLIGVFSITHRLGRSHPLPVASLRMRARPLAAALAVAAAGLSGWVAIGVLEGLPHTPDSLVYLMQADWLLDGSLWGPISDYQQYLTIPFTYFDSERWLAHYPPGWPSILAIGLGAGVPWLVAPVLGAVFLLLLYLTGRELGGDILGLIAATLGLLSPTTRLLFGSMLSHAATATLILGALYLTLVARNRGRWGTAALAGASLGLAFGIRPLTAAAVALPLGVRLLLDLVPSHDDRRALRKLVGWIAGVLAAATPTLVANFVITGNALAFPYSFASGSMYGVANIPFGLRNLDALLASFAAGIHGWGWSLVHGPLPGALALAFALVPFIAKRWRSSDVVLAAMIFCVLIAHLGTRGHGMHGFGSRYYFEIFAPFFLLTARGFQELGRARADRKNSERRAAVAASMGLFLALGLTAGASLPQRLSLYRGYNGVDSSLLRQLDEAGPERALILLTDEWQGWAMAYPRLDFDPDPALLFVQAPLDDPNLEELAGDREIFVWLDRTLYPVADTAALMIFRTRDRRQPAAIESRVDSE